MKVISIGRSSKNDYVISDSAVSSSHAIITVMDNGDVYIEDLNSLNGTYVDGKKVTKAQLSPSSVVLLANHSIDWKQIVQKGMTPPPPKHPVAIPSDVVDMKLIGRNPAAQIRYSFDDVSDKHAWLCRRKDGSVIIIDNNSTNGTFVNGGKVSSIHTLQKGDNLSISNRHPLNWEEIYPVKLKINIPLVASIAACAAIIIGILIWQPWNKDWSKVYSHHKHDVALIYVESAYAVTVGGYPLSQFLNGYDELDYCSLDDGGDIISGYIGSSGTGFFISEDGKLLTNRHVVGDPAREKENVQKIKSAIAAQLYLINMGKIAANLSVTPVRTVAILLNDTFVTGEKDLIPCSIIRVSDNEELDVAIIQTNDKRLPTGATMVNLSKAVPSEKLKLGTPLCTIGFPMSFMFGATKEGLEANNQSGEITQARGSYEYGHNITTHHGASGSPVYDKKGRFAGIIVSGYVDISQGYNHAIHPDTVLDFVSRAY